MTDSSEFQAIRRRHLRNGLLVWVGVLVVVFLLAGRLDYAQGWLYFALTAVTTVLGLWIATPSEALQKERLQPAGEIPRWDRIYFAISFPLWVLSMVVSPLDAGRLHLRPALPHAAVAIGSVLFLAGHAGFAWARLCNPFFSSVARVQTERGHQVCEAGPYRWIRHPGYLASAGYVLGGPLVLGSFWGLLPQIAAVGLLVWRTAREDQLLRDDLPGYREYSERVRWRLVPGLW